MPIAHKLLRHEHGGRRFEAYVAWDDIDDRPRPIVLVAGTFMGRSGFILGADLGLLFPLGTLRARIQDDNGALAQSGIPQADIDAARSDAETLANKTLNKLPLLVQVNLLRVGYMF